MQSDLKALIDRIDQGPIESRIQALDDFRSSFKDLLAAVVRAMQTEDPMFLIERVALLASAVLDTFLPVFETTKDEETKLMVALLLTQFGSKKALPWLLQTARTPGLHQYTATTQLAKFAVAEVKPMILEQLRSVPLSGALPLSSSDILSGLLDSWACFGEPLPDDLRAKLTKDDVLPGIKVAMKSLKL